MLTHIAGLYQYQGTYDYRNRIFTVDLAFDGNNFRAHIDDLVYLYNAEGIHYRIINIVLNGNNAVIYLQREKNLQIEIENSFASGKPRRDYANEVMITEGNL